MVAAVGDGVTVVTVSGASVALGTGATLGGAEAEGIVYGAVGAVLVGAGGVTVALTGPLSPPPRITTVQITATSRIAPATPATQTQRRSIGSSYS